MPKSKSSNKKFLIIAIIFGIILVSSSLAVIYTPRNQIKQNQQLQEKVNELKPYVINSNYVKEFETPKVEPVGIVIHDGLVWFSGSKERKIVVFDPKNARFDEFNIPSNVRNGTISIWDMKFDDENNLWFTDASTNSIWRFFVNEKRFEQYIIPSNSKDFNTTYPINLEFVDGKVWFSELFGKKIGILDPKKVKDKSSEGIVELDVPTKLTTLGPITKDRYNNLWFTAADFPYAAELYKLDTKTREFTRYDMKGYSPFSIAIDKYDRLWLTDHGSSSILIFDPKNNNLTNVVTSLPIRETNPLLYEECKNGLDESMCGGLPASFPYWLKIIDNKLWFNEHYGNVVGVLDIDNLVLIEYIVPTMDPNLVSCGNYKPCGIAEVLKFDANDKVWFTEWRENKIGSIDYTKAIPIKVEIEQGLTLLRGINNTINLKLRNEGSEPLNVEMRISGNVTPDGKLVNMSASFSERSLTISGMDSKDIKLYIEPKPNLKVGDYYLTITARLEDVMYSKLVRVKVV